MTSVRAGWSPSGSVKTLTSCGTIRDLRNWLGKSGFLNRKLKMETGTIINQYKIISPIGKGGMGEVLFGAIHREGDSVGRLDSNGQK